MDEWEINLIFQLIYISELGWSDVLLFVLGDMAAIKCLSEFFLPFYLHDV